MTNLALTLPTDLGSHPRYRHPPHLPRMSSKSTNSALRKLLPLPALLCYTWWEARNSFKCFEVIWEEPDTLFFPSGRGECNWERKQGLAPSLWGLSKWVKCTAFTVSLKVSFSVFNSYWATSLHNKCENGCVPPVIFQYFYSILLWVDFFKCTKHRI